MVDFWGERGEFLIIEFWTIFEIRIVEYIRNYVGITCWINDVTIFSPTYLKKLEETLYDYLVGTNIVINETEGNIWIEILRISIWIKYASKIKKKRRGVVELYGFPCKRKFIAVSRVERAHSTTRTIEIDGRTCRTFYRFRGIVVEPERCNHARLFCTRYSAREEKHAAGGLRADICSAVG